MSPHIMLSYQWDDQALVQKIYNRLREDGLPVWMDIKGGVKGNINDAMAAGVEEAVVICPFMTAAYQASRSCKKELNYADSREVVIMPVMLASEWEASEWLGLITAGLLWLDFRNADQDEEHFEMCIRSLEDEIMFNAGHLLPAQEAQNTEADQPETQKHRLKKKPGRAFRHARSQLYITDSGDEVIDPPSEAGNTVTLHQKPNDRCYWEEIKGSGYKYYKNVVTTRFLGFDPSTNHVHGEVSPSTAEEWLLLVDQKDQSHQRAVLIKNKHSDKFLAVQNGSFIGLSAYSEDCKWFLE